MEVFNTKGAKVLIKKILIPFLFHLNIYKIINFVRNRINRNTFTILVYHSFSKEKDDKPGVGINNFEQHIKYMRKNYHIDSLRNIIDSLKTGKRIKYNTIAITIDDGYLDNFKVAYPIIKKYGVPVTIFIATGYIENEEPRHSNGQKDSLVAEINDLERCKRDFYDSDVIRMGGRKMMKWSQVIELAKNGIEIGSHTVYHPILTKVPVEAARREIEISKKEIEERVKKRVRFFAFPNGLKGDFNNELCKIIEEVGYDAAFVVDWGLNHSDADIFKCKRIPMDNFSVPKLAMKISLIMSDP